MSTKQEQRLTEVEARAKSNSHRITDLENRQNNLDELVGAVQVLAVREENVESDVNEIKSDVKSLVGKSGKRWDSMTEKIFMMFVGAIVAFILAKIGL